MQRNRKVWPYTWEKKNQATEIAYERGQILDLAGKNQINYLKKSMITLSNQMENINKEIEIIKKKPKHFYQTFK